MTKSAIAVKTIQVSEEEEPPSSTITIKEAKEEEPPSTGFASKKNGLFNHVSASDWNDWKWHFRNRITSIKELSRFIPLSDKEQSQLKLVTAKYPLAITPYYLSLINLDDPDDPIRKQAIPAIEEISMGAMGMEDPLEEKRDSVVPGLVHRYHDRVLMVLTDICPMLCRHCTRKREWHNGGWVRNEEEIDAMLDFIRRTPRV